MERLLLTLLCTSTLLCTCVRAQTGSVHDDLSMRSEILGMERNYAVYLPPDYETSSRSYPVLYLLHGYSDNHTGWVQFGEVLRITDKAIRSGKATPMIIVMPDADTKRIGYFNSPDNSWRYEDFFFDELMPHVEKKYRIKGEKRFRAIAGLSMGGGGSFTYAMHHPELFSAACPLSAWAGGMSVDDVRQRFARDGETDYTEEQLEKYHASHNFVELAKSMDKEKLSSLRWYIDCGDDDFLFMENSQVHIELRKREIPHEYRVRQGGHSWTYWRQSLPEVLGFVSKGFHQF